MARKKGADTPEKKPAKRGRGRPALITRDDIISASLRATTELTLKSVAHELKVTPQALYRHVNGLGDILEMVTEKLAEVYPFPSDEGQDWFTYIYQAAHVLRRYYEAIPGLADYVMNAPRKAPVVLARYERSLMIALRTGLRSKAAYWACLAIPDFVAAWVARDQRREVLAQEEGQSDREIILAITEKPGADYPYLTMALRDSKDDSPDERFDITLRWLLMGIAAGNDLKASLPKKAPLRSHSKSAANKKS